MFGSDFQQKLGCQKYFLVSACSLYVQQGAQRTQLQHDPHYMLHQHKLAREIILKENELILFFTSLLLYCFHCVGMKS